MLRVVMLTAACAVPAACPLPARAQPGVTYPKVVGPTGRPYGPTQAHYQYYRQYGRAWQDPSGRTPVVSPGRAAAIANGVPVRGYSFRAPSLYYGRVPYGLGVSVNVPPVVAYGAVPTYRFVGGFVPLPANNPAIQRGLLENELRWNGPVAVPAGGKHVPKRKPKASSPEVKLKSLRTQKLGDGWFRKQEYGRALRRYQQAARQAEDRAEAHFRVGLAFAALGRHAEAVKAFRRGFEVDPEWASNSPSLIEVFGRENVLTKNSTLLRTADWVRDDIRDADRLFLMGVLMFLDDEPDKAAQFFETAWRLAGRGDHLAAALRLVDGENDAIVQVGEPPQPPAAGEPARPGPAAAPAVPEGVPSDEHGPLLPEPAEPAPPAEDGPAFPGAPLPLPSP